MASLIWKQARRNTIILGMNSAVALILPAAVAVLAHFTGATQAMGAHPWWADKVIWIGLPLGLIVAVLARSAGLTRPSRVICLGGLVGVGFAVALVGKSWFAASYGDSAWAGQMWFFGWIATCAFVAATLTSIVWPDAKDH